VGSPYVETVKCPWFFFTLMGTPFKAPSYWLCLFLVGRCLASFATSLALRACPRSALPNGALVRRLLATPFSFFASSSLVVARVLSANRFFLFGGAQVQLLFLACIQPFLLFPALELSSGGFLGAVPPGAGDPSLFSERTSLLGRR